MRAVTVEREKHRISRKNEVQSRIIGTGEIEVLFQKHPLVCSSDFSQIAGCVCLLFT